MKPRSGPRRPEVGDIVRLKSGGPAMLVVDIDDTNGHRAACCAWHKGRREGWWGEAMLTLLFAHKW